MSDIPLQIIFYCLLLNKCHQQSLFCMCENFCNKEFKYRNLKKYRLHMLDLRCLLDVLSGNVMKEIGYVSLKLQIHQD